MAIQESDEKRKEIEGFNGHEIGSLLCEYVTSPHITIDIAGISDVTYRAYIFHIPHYIFQPLIFYLCSGLRTH